MRKFIIGGNWKMQILNVEEAVSIATEISTAISGILTENVEVFISPSFNALYSVGQAIKGTKLKLCGQNMYFRDKGAFTGEISPDSLLDAGCEYVLLGHSERRRIFGESDAVINQKVKKALEKGLKPVLCIGETAKEKEEGKTELILQTQLENSLADVPIEQLNQLTIMLLNIFFSFPSSLVDPLKVKNHTEPYLAGHTVIIWLINIYTI